MLRLRTIFSIPLLLSCAYLIAIVFSQKVHYAFNSSPLVYAPLALALFVPGCFVVAAATNSHKQELWRAVLLSVCSVTPLAIFYPWIIIPGDLGLATGDFLFFLGWLTKYPDLGSVNLEVLSGIFCVILASFLPALFAYFSIGSKPKIWLRAIILLVETLATIPLFVNLDRFLLLFGVFGYALLGHETYIRSNLLAVGPLLRLTALAIAIFMMLKPLAYRKRSKNI